MLFMKRDPSQEDDPQTAILNSLHTKLNFLKALQKDKLVTVNKVFKTSANQVVLELSLAAKHQLKQTLAGLSTISIKSVSAEKGTLVLQTSADGKATKTEKIGAIWKKILPGSFFTLKNTSNSDKAVVQFMVAI